MKVFVYGTLKRGYHNNRLLHGASYLGEALTNKKYLLFGNGVPFAHPSEKGLPVKGEVFEIDEKVHLKPLDYLEGHPTSYTRKTISVTLLDNEEVVEADIYEMLRDWGSSQGTCDSSKGYYEWGRYY